MTLFKYDKFYNILAQDSVTQIPGVDLHALGGNRFLVIQPEAAPLFPSMIQYYYWDGSDTAHLLKTIATGSVGATQHHGVSFDGVNILANVLTVGVASGFTSYDWNGNVLSGGSLLLIGPNGGIHLEDNYLYATEKTSSTYYTYERVGDSWFQVKTGTSLGSFNTGITADHNNIWLLGDRGGVFFENADKKDQVIKSSSASQSGLGISTDGIYLYTVN